MKQKFYVAALAIVITLQTTSVQANTGRMDQAFLDWKEQARLLSLASAGVAGAHAAVALLLPSSAVEAAVYRPFQLYFGLMGITLGFATKMWDTLVVDPSDPNYKVIVLPVIPNLDLSAYPADMRNSIKIEEQIMGLSNALVISNNRAVGAEEAGDKFWEQQQVDAMKNYGTQLAPLLAQVPTELAKLESQVDFSWFDAFTDSQLTAVLNLSFLGGPPEDIQALAEQLGISSTQLDSIVNLWLTPDNIHMAANIVHNRFNDPVFDASSMALSQTFASPIPEPSPILLWIGGLLLVALARVRSKWNFLAMLIRTP